jgi:hypothetical protein
VTSNAGRATAQAVSRRSVTAEVRVQFQDSQREISGEQSGTGLGFSPTPLVFPCQSHSPGAPLQGKRKTIIFITGVHNWPQGCSVSVASAVGPFTTTKTSYDVDLKAWPFHSSGRLNIITKF